MSRCLSQELIKYQNAEEAKVLSIANDLGNTEKKLVRELYEPLKITVDDINREYSAADVRQLCLRTKARVNMTLFNCLWDAKKRFDKKGRLEGRSERFVDAMLVKAVKKQMVVPYTAQDIAKCNHIRQCQLKKDNNARLDRWQLEKTQQSQIEEFNNADSSLLLAQLPPNEELLIPIKETTPNIIYPTSEATQSQEASLSMPASEMDLWINKEVEEEEEEEDVQIAVKPVATAANLLKEACGSSQVSIPDWAQAAAEINTESITNDTMEVNLETPQSDSQPSSQVVEDYQLFGTQVPSTSTQTPQTEPFI